MQVMSMEAFKEMFEITFQNDIQLRVYTNREWDKICDNVESNIYIKSSYDEAGDVITAFPQK